MYNAIFKILAFQYVIGPLFWDQYAADEVSNEIGFYFIAIYVPVVVLTAVALQLICELRDKRNKTTDRKSQEEDEGRR